MKKLTITESQSSKLIEMAETLFPKNKTWRFTFVKYNYLLEYADQKNVVNYIPWLEFVMFELAEKILNPNPIKWNKNSEKVFEKFYWNTNMYWSGLTIPDVKHPIDYLYEQFKKLK